MKVLFVASECAPLVKTGGLADVVGALPSALAEAGCEVRVLLPAYPAVAEMMAEWAAETGAESGANSGASGGAPAMLADVTALCGCPARLVAGRVGSGQVASGRAGSGQLASGQAGGLDLIALDAPALFDRPGNPYLGPDGADWPDNALRFGALGRVAAFLAGGGTGASGSGEDGAGLDAAGSYGTWGRPDLVHVHDWQAGLTPLYMRLAGGPMPPCLLTVHNIAFQGLFPALTMGALGLPLSGFHPDGFEFYGQVGFLKAGLVWADRINTVSPGYARELMQPAFGMGLEGVLAWRRQDFCGILNGIDTAVWNPAADPLIAAAYDADDLAGKAACRAALETRFGLAPDPAAPLLCVISRLTRQKGLDLLLQALPRLLDRGGRLVVLGTGDADLEAGFRAAASAHPGRVGAIIGYDEALSHQMQAGADAIVVPSRFEPCGLTQLYGLRYGTVPLVARTGGLADTVIDANSAALAQQVATGFQVAPGSAADLADGIDRLCDLFADPPAWRAMVRRGMAQDVGWRSAAAEYAALYARMIAAGPRRQPVGPAAAPAASSMAAQAG